MKSEDTASDLRLFHSLVKVAHTIAWKLWSSSPGSDQEKWHSLSLSGMMNVSSWTLWAPCVVQVWCDCASVHPCVQAHLCLVMNWANFVCFCRCWRLCSINQCYILWDKCCHSYQRWGSLYGCWLVISAPIFPLFFTACVIAPFNITTIITTAVIKTFRSAENLMHLKLDWAFSCFFLYQIWINVSLY